MLQNKLQEHHPTTYVITRKSLSMKKIVFLQEKEGEEHIKELHIQIKQGTLEANRIKLIMGGRDQRIRRSPGEVENEEEALEAQPPLPCPTVAALPVPATAALPGRHRP